MNKQILATYFIVVILLNVGSCLSHVSAQINSGYFDHPQRDGIFFKYQYNNANKLNCSAIKTDKVFFILDSLEMLNHNAMTTIVDRPDYKSFAMSLKYYSNRNLEIRYKPQYIHTHYENTIGCLDKLSSSCTYSDGLSEPYDLRKAAEKLFIEHPDLVKFVWEEIPEPHRMITDRRQLRRRSAEESIATLIKDEKFDAPKKLEKPVDDDGPWEHSGTESLQVSQTYLENWTKGGESSIAVTSDLLLKADYNKNKIEWESYIRDQVGIVNSETYNAQISTDQIEANSKIGLQASKKWYYSFVSNFKSQVFNNYTDETKEEMTSRILSPAYFTLSLGMDYKPSKNFTLMLSPVSAKLTYVMDTVNIDQTDYNIDDNKKSAFNNGLSVTNTVKWEISTELNLTSSLDAFIGYGSSSDLYQIDYEVIFNMRINKYLSTKVNTQFRYFTNESLSLQIRENIAVSLNYTF